MSILSVNITEHLINSVLSQIKTNISEALSAIRTDRNDPSVNTELPKSYFTYAPVQGFRCPAVVLVANDTDFRLDRGPNAISAVANVTCSVCVEERDLEKLQKKAWRYQDALFTILDRAQISGTGFKYIIKVMTIRYSADAAMKDDDANQSVFRKEVALDLEIENYQND